MPPRFSLVGRALLGATTLGACRDGDPRPEIRATPAGDPGVYAGADLDRNGRVAEREFAAWWQARGPGRHWAAAGPRGVSVSKFARHIYGVWSRDGTALLMPEWRRGAWGWFGRRPGYGTFADWDTSNDLVVDEREFVAAADRYGVFAAWDANRDGRVGADEYGAGAFAVFDRNRDGAVTAGEWRAGAQGWRWGP